MSIAALGYEIDSSQAVRAERDLDRMAAAADRAGDGAEGLERQSSGLAATLRALAPVAGAIAGSLAAMFSARAVIGAAETYETRMARINAIIRATGGVAGRTAEQLEAQAQALARATLESVDGVMNAQQVLLTFRNVQGEVFDRAIEGAADLAAAMGTDIVGATRQLARALEDPINGVTALTRSGTVFTQQQRDQIRALVESGRTLEAQNIILAELEGQYGGAAREAGGLTAAKDSLGQSINNLLISINTSIGLTDALAVVYNRTADGVQYLADNIGILWNALRALGVVVAALAATQIPALVAVLAAKTAGMTAASIAAGVMATAMRGLAAAVVFLGGPLGLVLGITGGLTAAMVLFRDTTDTVAPIMDSARDAVNQLNAALATSESQLPATARETLNLTNENIRLAQSAYAAAEAQVALAQASLQYAQTELGLQQAFSPTGEYTQAINDQQAAWEQLRLTQTRLMDAQSTLTDRINEGQLALTSAGETMAENQRRAIELSVTMSDLGSVIAGGGGGAGADDSGLLSRFEALRDQLRSQAEQVEIWYAEAQDALQWALQSERITLEEHANLRLEIERLYQQQLSAIRSQAQAQQLGETADFFGAMAEVAQQGGERMTRVARAMGAAQALINTYVAASQTLADPTLGFFAKFAAVASVIASGMGLVNAIKGGGKTGPSSSQPVSGVTQSQEPLRRTIVELRGAEWARGIIDPIIEEIFRASGNGQRITLA
jgi:hypothetical protein